MATVPIVTHPKQPFWANRILINTHTIGALAPPCCSVHQTTRYLLRGVHYLLTYFTSLICLFFSWKPLRRVTVLGVRVAFRLEMDRQ